MSEIIKSVYQGAIANVFHFTTAPTTSENVNTGYEAGDFAIVNNNDIYQLVDEAAGTWVKLCSGSSGFSSFPPSFSNPITVTLNSNVDNWLPSGFDNTVDCIIITGNTSNVEITGIDPSMFNNGQGLVILNTKNATVKLKNNNGGSLNTNRFLLRADVDIKYGTFFSLIRSTLLNRWSGIVI